MIPAGRYEMLQARKADMGADLSRAVMNSVITQISNGGQLPDLEAGKSGYFVVANDFATNNLSERLSTRLNTLGFQNCSTIINDNRTFNGNDDAVIMEGNDRQMQVTLENGEAIGTGYYTAFATIVPMGEGFWEVTGLTVYRFTDDDKNNVLRGSYIFCPDNSGKSHWYKIENIYTPPRGTASMDTVAGTFNVTAGKYVGEIIGVCKKVIRIDGSYKVNN